MNAQVEDIKTLIGVLQGKLTDSSLLLLINSDVPDVRKIATQMLEHEDQYYIKHSNTRNFVIGALKDIATDMIKRDMEQLNAKEIWK